MATIFHQVIWGTFWYVRNTEMSNINKRLMLQNGKTQFKKKVF